ncbi:putative DNA directed DNA polymerase [Acinetobacter phage Pipo]|uniref:Putative DNA directed DNA polymerase n=1 Tax=Acinetobacter phage Pipo TaxID=2797425 RepID=A0A7T8ETP3_9CAUD|nr:putative DNA directed DNA polymerase [Acinetobacter phage Pipo]
MKHNWIILDFEVENYEYCGSLASPHCPENYVVAAGWACDNGLVKSEYYTEPDQWTVSTAFDEDLLNSKVLVAHNLSFELHWLLATKFELIKKFLNNGGRVFCTQYAEFLITHQTEMYPKLEDCSVKYGGTKKIDAVKLLWEQGYKTSEIDQALLMEYLADEHSGDVANTRRVCFAQVAYMQEVGMYEMAKLRMDSLLFNAIATYNGLYVNMDVAKKNMDEQYKRIAELQEDVRSYLPKDLPAELEFSFTSGYHMSAFLFGGTITYDKKVSYDPPKFEQVEVYQFTRDDGTVEYLEPDTINKIEDCEIERGGVITKYKAGRNKGLPKTFKIDSGVEKLKWGKGTYRFEGLVNFNELPKHVSEQFTGDRAEFKGKRVHTACGTPVYSTGDDALDLVAKFTEAAQPLRDMKKLIKDTTTYYLVEDDKGKQSGMLQYVEPNGIIHHQLNNCATITGRLSGSRPNMQNIPRDGTSRVKQMFESRFGKEGRIVEVDYSALEVVALASISGDKNLLQQLIDGTDMHCYRLAGALGEDYATVFEKCHDKSHPEHKKYKQLRTDIKPRAFANQYGASAMGISFSTGCSLEEAEQFKETERKLFPESSTYAERVVRPQVEQNGLTVPMESELVNGVWKHFRRGFFKANSGTCYSFRQFPKYVKGVGEKYDYKDTQIANYPIQGEASLIVQAACGRVIRELIARNFAGGLVLPINTVHDAIYLDCATESLANEYGKLVQEIMESTPKYMAEIIPALKEWRYDTTPFPAAAEYGINMMDKVDVT